MSALFVGQRVRLVKAPPRSELPKDALLVPRNSEGVIISRSPFDPQWEVRIFGCGTGWADSWMLEPILPDGLESLDRINELYEPEPEVIRV